MVVTKLDSTRELVKRIGEPESDLSHVLGASGVQIPQKNLDNLRSTKEEEDGATEVFDPQDVSGSILLEITDFAILVTSRGMGSLRGTLLVAVILVKGHTFLTKVKVLPVVVEGNKDDDDDSEDRLEPKSHKDKPEYVDDDDDKGAEKPCIAAMIIEDRDDFRSKIPDLVSQEFNAQAPKIIKDLFKNYVQSNVKSSSSTYKPLPSETTTSPDLQQQLYFKRKKSSRSQQKQQQQEWDTWVEEIVIDEDEVILKDETPELIVELQDVDKRVPSIFDYERRRATLNDALSNQFKNAEESDSVDLSKKKLKRNLKAKKESSNEECSTSGSEDEEYAMAPPRDKNQRAFVGGYWSDSIEEDDEKVKDETCLVAHASSEVCSESSYFSDKNSSIDDTALDNEYVKLCKMSLKIITKNKKLKATRNSLENEVKELKDKLFTHEKNKGADLDCAKCHVLKIENEKLKDESTRLNKFEKSTHCFNEMLSNQKPSGDKLSLGFNSFESQKKAYSDGGPINMGGPLNDQAARKINMGPPPVTSGFEKTVSFQKSFLGHRPKHIIVNKGKLHVASDNEVKQFYKPLLKPRVRFSKPNFRSKTPPPRRVDNNYSRPKTLQPKRHVGRQNQPHSFPICHGVDLEPDGWIKDSRCSKHMTGNRKLFSTYKAYNGGNVIFGSNLCGNIIGKGTISNDTLKIDNVEHVDNLGFNLLSIGQICDNKCRVTFFEHDSEITKDGKVIDRGIRKKGLYVMKLGNKPKDQICLTMIDENSTLWHRRLGHVNMHLIQSLASKELVRNLPKLKFDQHFCDACKIGKQAHTSHKAKNVVSMTRCLELLHMDLFGPSAVRSYGGNRYSLFIVDDYSRYTWTRFLKDKTEAFDQFKIFSRKIQNQLELKNVNEALGDESWIVAMQEELNQFIANDVWELVPQPRNMTIIGTKWVFRNKLDENGIVSRNKARLVAQGYNQQEGIDYDETYALVARLESIRILLAYACALDFKLFQMDVKSAFLNGFINEEVYMAQPLGFIDFEKPNHVYKLKKALYGLKQAPKAWYDRLKAFLIKHEYKMGMVDNTLFTKKKSSNLIIVQIYVDDIIFGSTCQDMCDEFAKIMHDEFEMSMMGELNFFLGL
ncbi:retrovirus-related pol polyprotein from transposon TNT 1-94 [Tanacetum coccineum]|uniref:Retrovirus-related pol polyprotein from transposon TNT 1-94 n=1 Tax=Tanacetum coccineum TaxID=301880 RepID=A0ABQ5GKC0_9ASTR